MSTDNDSFVFNVALCISFEGKVIEAFRENYDWSSLSFDEMKKLSEEIHSVVKAAISRAAAK